MYYYIGPSLFTVLYSDERESDEIEYKYEIEKPRPSKTKYGTGLQHKKKAAGLAVYSIRL